MRYETKINIGLLFLVTMSICFGILVTIAYNALDIQILNKNNNLYSDSCDNADLINTSLCLKEQLSKFYNYNFSNAGKNLNLEELSKEGGVCSHYANWYKDRANELGFYATETLIHTSSDADHVYTTISDETGYCILDQLTVKCIPLGSAK